MLGDRRGKAARQRPAASIESVGGVLRAERLDGVNESPDAEKPANTVGGLLAYQNEAQDCEGEAEQGGMPAEAPTFGQGHIAGRRQQRQRGSHEQNAQQTH